MVKNVKMKSGLLIAAILASFVTASAGWALDPTVFPGKGSKDAWRKAGKFYDAGLALAKTGNHDGAIFQYQRAISTYAHSDVYYRNLGVDYEGRKQPGDVQKAEVAYRKAAELDPKDWRNWNAVAGITAAQNKYQDCRKAALQALACNPPSKDAAEIRTNLSAVEQYLAKNK